MTAKINDIVDKLETHPERTWGQRSLEAIQFLVVHQSAYNPRTGKPFEDLYEINAFHIEPTIDRNNDGVIDAFERNHLVDTGAPKIAYHYVIERDGEIYKCNEHTDLTWHVRSYNGKSIGILVNGNFNGAGWVGSEAPTNEQVTALPLLLDYLLEEIALAKSQVVGHCELSDTKPACPGNILMDTIENYRIINI